MLPFEAALVWTLLMLPVVVAPAIVPVLCTLQAGAGGRAADRASADAWRPISALRLTQSLFILVFLADQAWLMADAIVRTLYRLFVSRRLLLEWVSHAQTVTRRATGAAGAGAADGRRRW